MINQRVYRFDSLGIAKVFECFWSETRASVHENYPRDFKVHHKFGEEFRTFIWLVIITYHSRRPTQETIYRVDDIFFDSFRYFIGPRYHVELIDLAPLVHKLYSNQSWRLAVLNFYLSLYFCGILLPWTPGFNIQTGNKCGVLRRTYWTYRNECCGSDWWLAYYLNFHTLFQPEAPVFDVKHCPILK